jgi:Restriction endonuclease
MKREDPILFDYFEQWDKQNWSLYHQEQDLALKGQWEGAWALAQLHYDQLLRYEAKYGCRQHKGHSLCNLALVGQTIDSPALTRHYALLSSAGDIYWEHKDSNLKFGGLAPTILERFESHHQQDEWRNRVRDRLTTFGDSTPVYLESLVASRWFTDTYANHIINLAKIDVKKNAGNPFVEVLLDAVENPDGASDTTTGARFEAAAGLLLSATPGFEVDSGRRETDEQVDLVVYYIPDRLTQISSDPGCGLVECKSSRGPVQAKELRDFGAKCLFHRVKFGILFARAGTTHGADKFENWQYAEHVRRRFQADGLTLLVVNMDEIRGKSRDLRGLQDSLSADYKLLVFGRKP